MIRSRLARLAAMPPRELSGRAAMVLGQRADAVRWKLRRPVWRRQSLARAIDASHPAMQQAVRLIAAGDSAGAHRVISDHFVSRPPRFAVSPTDRGRVARLIAEHFPGADADARRRADAVLAGSYDLLGYRGLSFTTATGTIDWHRDPVHARQAPLRHWTGVPYLDPVLGDHKVIWELNRHQHWLVLGRAYWLTGERRYRNGVIDQLRSWLMANPPRTGINWASMLELAFRSLSWVWALHLLAESAGSSAQDGPDEVPWTVDVLLGLDEQLRLVERNLSIWFSPNTHLLGEALALYVAGRVLPELRAANRWAALGRSVLVNEIERQIHPDGGHAELSTHYHRYTLDFYLLALAVARATGDTAAAPPLERAALRLATFAQALADDEMRLPQFGDDDGGMLFPICGTDALNVSPSLAVAAALLQRPELAPMAPHEEAVWMTGAAPLTAARVARRASVLLPHTGYAVSRTGRGDHLVIDVGSLGYLNGGHAHADALSVTLTVAGSPLLIDTGTGAYTVDPAVRDQRRGTAAHNTVTVGDRWQSEPASAFQWRSRAASAVHVCRFTPEFDFIEASHDGYGGDGHRRQVLARPGCWTFVDWIGGGGERAAAVHWHLDPAWHVAPRNDRTLELTHGSGTQLWLMSLTAPFTLKRAAADGQGWYAPVYGSLAPLTTARAEMQAVTPFTLATVILESEAEPMLEALPPAGDALAFRLHGSGWTETFVAGAPGAGDVSGAPFGIPACGRFLCARAGSPRPELWVVESAAAVSAAGPVGASRGASESTAARAVAAR